MATPENDDRLVRDVAAATARAVLEVFNLNHLRPEEVREAEAAVAEAVEAGLVAYTAFRREALRRICGTDPSDN